jgi:hypothetical protein
VARRSQRSLGDGAGQMERLAAPVSPGLGRAPAAAQPPAGDRLDAVAGKV